MRVAIPHTLGKDEVRRRLRERAPEIADMIPGGKARVVISWPEEFRMAMGLAAMGHTMTGGIVVTEDEAIFTLDLPAQLGFASGMVEQALTAKGRLLLA